jgi:putative hydrolase
MDPVTALQRVAFLLEKSGAARYKSQAFRRAADVIRGIDADELAAMAGAGTLTRLDGIGASTAKVVTEALADDTPEYLAELERVSGGAGPGGADTADGPRRTARTARTATDGHDDRHEADTPAALADAEELSPDAVALRAVLQGDCHSHSLWSDGGASIRDMAEAARDLGHRYLVMTDHSPWLTVAHGLTADRLRQQLDEIAGLNDELAPFRILTGIEVDILADGALDQTDELLAALDVVVASAHSKLRAISTTRLLPAE